MNNIASLSHSIYKFTYLFHLRLQAFLVVHCKVQLVISLREGLNMNK